MLRLLALAVFVCSASVAEAQENSTFLAARGKDARCRVLNPWISSIKVGAKDDIGSLTAQEIWRLSAVRFEAVVGKRFSALSQNERKALADGLRDCSKESWVRDVLADPLTADPTKPNARALAAVHARQEANPAPATASALPAPSPAAAAQLRYPIGKFLLETDEAIVYEKECSRFSASGSNIVDVVVKSTDPSFIATPDNPSFRAFVETTLIPLIKRHCRYDAMLVVGTFIANVRLDQSFNESFGGPPSYMEAPLNTISVVEKGPPATYSVDGYPSLAAMRRSRDQKTAASKAAQQVVANEAAAAVRARDARAVRVAADADAELARALPRLSPEVRAWYTELIEARSMRRDEFLSTIGRVRLEYRPPVLGGGTVPTTEVRAIAADVVAPRGLKVDDAAPLTLSVRVELPSAVELTSTSTFASEATVMTPTWVVASIHSPATVLEQDGFRRSRVTLASAIAGGIDKGRRPTADTVRNLIREAIGLALKDAGLDFARVSDRNWRTHLGTISARADELWGRFVLSRSVTGDGVVGDLAGVSSLGAVHLSASPFNRVPMFSLRQSFLGMDFWQGEPVWRKALAAAAVPDSEPAFDPGYLPFLSYRISGTSATAHVVAGQTSELVGGMGEAAVVEPNCLMRGPAGLIRTQCKVWTYDHFGVGLANNSDYAQHVFTVLDKGMQTGATGLGTMLSATRSTSPSVAALPRADKSPQMAFERINLGRTVAERQPLLFKTRGDAYVAGIDKGSSQFKVFEVPYPQILEAIRELELSLQRSAGKPNATRENLVLAVKERFPAYRFAMESYAGWFDSTAAFPEAASRANIMDLEIDASVTR